MTAQQPEQKCWRCKRILSLNDFYKNRSRANGYSTTCKKCALELQHLKHPRKRSGVIKDKIKEPKRRDACVTMKVHHKQMKDDPDHLSTEFIQKIIGRKCTCQSLPHTTAPADPEWWKKTGIVPDEETLQQIPWIPAHDAAIARADTLAAYNRVIALRRILSVQYGDVIRVSDIEESLRQQAGEQQ